MYAEPIQAHFPSPVLLAIALPGVWWAVALCVCAAVLVCWRFWHSRVPQLIDSQRRLQQDMKSIEAQKGKLEHMLREVEQASRFRSEFLANMSDEIRTPMNAIVGMTSLVLETELTRDQRQYLEIARNYAESLLSVLNDILDISNLDADRLELDSVEFSVRKWLDDMVHTLKPRADEKHLDLLVSIQADVPDRLLGDPMRLRQLLIHLAGNAIRFTEKGSVKILIAQEADTTNFIHLRFSVSDTGVGIPLNRQQGIFEAFRQSDGFMTTKHGVSGLGLPICSRIVKLMGGQLALVSDIGRGSTFHFTAQLGIPGSESQRPAAYRADEPGQVGIGGLRILVVEDDPINQTLTAKLLEKSGNEVMVAANGVRALETIQHQRFDLILMDIQMPEMDGLDATRAIRELEKATNHYTPIVMLTAHALKEDRERSLRAGADGHVAKPIHLAELFEAIQVAILAGHHPPASSRQSVLTQ